MSGSDHRTPAEARRIVDQRRAAVDAALTDLKAGFAPRKRSAAWITANPRRAIGGAFVVGLLIARLRRR